MSKNNEPDDKPTSQSNNNHDQGAQSNQQANESAQANTNHPGSNPINAQSGDGSTTHIDNSDNSKGLEYLYKIVRQLQEEKRKLQEEKDRLVDELHSKSTSLAEAEAKIRLKAVEEELTRVKKEIRSVEQTKEGKPKGRSLKIAGLVATSVVMAGGALVVTYLPQEGIKKARSLPISVVDSAKNENPSKRKNKKSSQLDHVEIETGIGQEKKANPLSKMKFISKNENKKLQPKESFVDTMRRIEKERVEEFGVNKVLEGLLVQRSIAKVKGVDAPKVGQVFALGEKIEVGVDFEVLGGSVPVNILVRSSNVFAKPVFRVQLSGGGVSKVVLPELGVGVWYLEVTRKNKTLGMGKFLVD